MDGQCEEAGFAGLFLRLLFRSILSITSSRLRMGACVQAARSYTDGNDPPQKAADVARYGRATRGSARHCASVSLSYLWEDWSTSYSPPHLLGAAVESHLPVSLSL